MKFTLTRCEILLKIKSNLPGYRKNKNFKKLYINFFFAQGGPPAIFFKATVYF